jgi:ADP-heptose:LPS heptosyltransferase
MRNVLLRLLFHLVRLFRPARTNSGARVVLVLQYQMPLGCCVHGTPLYAAIKAANPAAILIVATRGLGLDVLRHDPCIDFLIDAPSFTGSLNNMRKAVAALRRELRLLHLVPDLVLQDASSRAGSFALFALLLRLGPTAGFANAPALYDVPLTYDRNLSLIDNNLRLAELAGAGSQHREPAVYFAAADLATAQALLAETDPGSQPGVAFVMQGSGGQRTGWHDDRFAAVIRHVESLGYRTLFLGTASDPAGIDRIRSLASSTGVSLAGRTSIPELAAVLCLCDFLVTLDTGTLHVARAVDLPMVVLGPCWQKPLEWLPLTKANVRILRGEDRSEVPAEYRLDEIEASSVVDAFNDLERSYPPSSENRQRRIEQLLSTTRS